MTRRPGRSSRVAGEVGLTTLELVVGAPGLLLVIGLLVVAGRVNGANAAVEQAAADAARSASIARTPGAASTSAVTSAQQSLAAQAVQCTTVNVTVDTGELDNLSKLSIVPTVTDGQVRVTVSARTVSLLPGLPGPRVSQTAAGELERFTSRSSP